MLDRRPIGDHVDAAGEGLGSDTQVHLGADHHIARPLALAIGGREVDDFALHHEPDRDLVGLAAPASVVG